MSEHNAMILINNIMSTTWSVSKAMNIRAIIKPIVYETYSRSDENAFVDACIDDLTKLIDGWALDPIDPFRRSREDQIMLRCWDWFSGGGVAAICAKEIEAALKENENGTA